MAQVQLTATIQKDIIAYIRAGAFPDVAAEAVNVPRATFEEWMEKGERPRAAGRYRNFAQAVRQAQAQARVSAEVTIRQDRPLDWLKHGPGRPTGRSSGWTAPAKASERSQERLLLLEPMVQRLCAFLLDHFQDQPQAKEQVSEVILQLHEAKRS